MSTVYRSVNETTHEAPHRRGWTELLRLLLALAAAVCWAVTLGALLP